MASYRSTELVSQSIAKAPYGTCEDATHRLAQLCLTEQETIVLVCNNQSCHNNHQLTRLIHEIFDDRKRQQVCFRRVMSLTIRYKVFKKTASESKSNIKNIKNI